MSKNQISNNVRACCETHILHKQVLSIKGFFVDTRIKQLIDVLNIFPKVKTFESCQGDNGEYAFVFLDYKGTTKELLNFAQYIAEYFCKLSQKSNKLINPAYELDIEVKWYGNKQTPFIALIMPPETIDYIANIFSLLVKEAHYDI